MKKLHLICNAHLDPVWMWSWDEGQSMALATYYSAAELLDEYDYVFCHNELALYEYVEKHNPALFAKIKELVKAGKWHIMGGWYLQPDCNLPSGESFVRQILGGREYFLEKFGAAPKTAVNFDSFGHTRGLVQILKKCGQDSYICCRPMPELLGLSDNVINWRGYDGSTVKAVRVNQRRLYTTRLGKAKEDIEEFSEEWLKKDIGMILWGVGNHGGGASRKDLEDIESLAKEKASEYAIIHSTPEAYFAECKPSLTFSKPLTPCLVKCYTSLSSIKQKHIELETKLYVTERIAALAEALCGEAYDFEKLEYAQKNLCLFEFHDILSGTCGPDGEKDSLRMADSALEALNEVFMKSYFVLTRDEVAAGEGEYPIFVFNPHPHERETVVEVEFLVEKQLISDTECHKILVYADGKPVPAQIIKELTNINYDRRHRVAFKCKLKPMGITRFDFKVENVPIAKLPEMCDDLIFEDSVKRVVISKKTGLMTEYTVNGVNYLSGGAFEPCMYEDNADPWGFNLKSVGKNGRKFRLSDCKRGAFEGFKSVRMIEDGDVLTEVECLFERSASFVRVSYKIYRDLPYVDVNVNVLWNEKEKVLKLKIPTIGGNMLAETAYGTEKLTKDGAEHPMHRFVAMEKGGRCLAVYNNCTYGVSCTGNAISLTLLNGSAYAAHPIGDRPLVDSDRHIPYIEQGKRDFGFRIGVCERKSLAASAQEFVEKPYALNVFPHGEGRKVQDTVTLDNTAISLHVFKRSKNGGYILRLFNNGDKSQGCTVSVFGKEKKLTFKKFEIKTLKYDGEKIVETKEIEI